jgi:hypothetical protein
VATNAQIIEALWGLGYDEATLRAIPTTGKQSAFTTSLFQKYGIKGADVDTAIRMADWRPNEEFGWPEHVTSYLKDVLGLGDAGVKRFGEAMRKIQAGPRLGGGEQKGEYVKALMAVLPPQQVTQALIKLGWKNELNAVRTTEARPGMAPIGAALPQWNPLRSDAPAGMAKPVGGVTKGVRPPPKVAAPTAPGAPGAPGAKISTTGVTPSPGDVAQAVTGTAATDLTPALGAGATDDQVRKYVNEHYGQYAYLYDVPELKDKVLRPAVVEGWDADRIIGALETTTWWQKTESSARLFKEEKYRDPASVADKVNAKFTVFKNLVRAKGITVPDADLREMASDAIEFDWDDNETTAAMGRFFKYDPSNLLGEAADTAVTMRQLHKAYLIPLSDATVQTWTEKVMRGDATTDDFEDYLRTQSKALFPMLSNQIDLGVTPDQWVDPYRQIAAQTLGLNPEAIDFRDPKWLAALDEPDPKTGSRRPMYLSDWTNKLKTDDVYGWDKTAQGREHGANLAKSLAQTFGRA